MIASRATTSALAAGGTFEPVDSARWYGPVLLGASTVGALASSAECIRQALAVVEKLEPDDYSRYLVAYYKTALDRYGDSWRYADIVTVLRAAAQLLRPAAYLEIGVRGGRSAAVVAATAPDCDIIGFDWWEENYAGMPN